MKKYLYLLVILFLSIPVVFANPPAGKGPSTSVGTVAGGPPGLHGKTPAGKTPYGWSQGKKKGWYKTHHHHYYHSHPKS